MRRTLHDLDPDVPLADLGTFADIRRTTMGGPRSLLGLLGIFAGVGLLLGGIGSFTVAAAWVAHGRRDIGVRMAVGADASRVVRETLGRGLLHVALSPFAELDLYVRPVRPGVGAPSADGGVALAREGDRVKVSRGRPLHALRNGRRGRHQCKVKPALRDCHHRLGAWREPFH